MSPKFIEQMKEDLAAEELKRFGVGTFGDTMRSCISKGELEHMESPAADEMHQKKLDGMMESFFSKVPLPKDPMRAALAPTKEELTEIERFEVLKEAVRERYHANNQRKRSEEQRISAAMKQVEDGSHPSYDAMHKYDAYEPLVSRVEAQRQGQARQEAEEEETEALKRELEEMKRKVASLESKMRARRT